MRRFSAPLFLLLLTACMASGGSAAEQAGDIRIENGPLLGAPRATHQLVSTGKGQLLAIGGCVRAGCEVGESDPHRLGDLDQFLPVDGSFASSDLAQGRVGDF